MPPDKNPLIAAIEATDPKLASELKGMMALLTTLSDLKMLELAMKNGLLKAQGEAEEQISSDFIRDKVLAHTDARSKREAITNILADMEATAMNVREIHSRILELVP